MTEPKAFDPVAALEALTAAGVHYVVIGAFAGRLHGSPTLTRDLDICYARDQADLEALAEMLQDVHARLRGVDRDVPLRLDAKTLAAGDSFTFTTDVGDLDVLGTPTGTGGYADLIRTAVEMDLGGVRVQVAALDDLIRMKRAAGRPKDLIEVEVLGALREEIEASKPLTGR